MIGSFAHYLPNSRADPCDSMRPHCLNGERGWFECKLLECLTTVSSTLFEDHRIRNVEYDEASSHCACCEETGAKAESEDRVLDMQVRAAAPSVPLETHSPQADMM